MTGLDQLKACFQGDEQAVQLLLLIREISHTWDDLIDQDQPVTHQQIHRAFWLALVGLKTNTFYQRYEALLLPVMETGIFNYAASVDLERIPGLPREIAHTARYAVGDVALLMARLIGGVDWAMEQAAVLKQLLQTDTFENFNAEMEAKYGSTHDSPAA